MTSWFPDRGKHLIHGRGRGTDVLGGRKSEAGHLSTAAHDLAFQKTGLGFSHTAQGFNGGEAEAASAPKAEPQMWPTTSPTFLVESTQASPESGGRRNRLLRSVATWPEHTGREVTDGGRANTQRGTRGASPAASGTGVSPPTWAPCFHCSKRRVKLRCAHG